MATEKNWTVMVYMAGDNNLDSAGVVDLTEMKKVGSTKEINILVQFDREGRNMATNRYYVQKDGTPNESSRPFIRPSTSPRRVPGMSF